MCFLKVLKPSLNFLLYSINVFTDYPHIQCYHCHEFKTLCPSASFNSLPIQYMDSYCDTICENCVSYQLSYYTVPKTSQSVLVIKSYFYQILDPGVWFVTYRRVVVMIESNMMRHADYDIEYRITEVEVSSWAMMNEFNSTFLQFPDQFNFWNFWPEIICIDRNY